MSVASAGRDAVTLSPTEGSLRVHWDRLPDHSEIYDSDAVGVAKNDDAVSLFFGKTALNSGPDGLRSRVEIRYALDDFRLRFWPNCEAFYAGLRAHEGPPPKTDGISILRLSATRETSDWANLEYLSYSGSQASLDFYRIPVSGIARWISKIGSAGLIVEPILRVLTTRRQLYRLLALCEAIGQNKAE